MLARRLLAVLGIGSLLISSVVHSEEKGKHTPPATAPKRPFAEKTETDYVNACPPSAMPDTKAGETSPSPFDEAIPYNSFLLSKTEPGARKKFTPLRPGSDRGVVSLPNDVEKYLEPLFKFRYFVRRKIRDGHDH